MDMHSLDQLFDKYHALAKQHGCAVITVFGDPKKGSLPFTYSVGFAQFGFPDVVITGPIPSIACKQLINSLLSQWKEKGMAMGLNYDLIQNFPMKIVRLEEQGVLAEDYVLHNIHFYNRFPDMLKPDSGLLPGYVQLLWPDTSGAFPDASGYDHKRCPQTVLPPKRSN